MSTISIATQLHETFSTCGKHYFPKKGDVTTKFLRFSNLQASILTSSLKLLHHLKAT